MIVAVIAFTFSLTLFAAACNDFILYLGNKKLNPFIDEHFMYLLRQELLTTPVGSQPLLVFT